MPRVHASGGNAEDDEACCEDVVSQLEAHRAAILDLVLAEVHGSPELPRARELSGPQLRDHLPNLLDRLTAHLRGAPRVGASLPARSAANEHGHQRWEQQYQLHELVRELGIVERIVLREAVDPLAGGGSAARARASASARDCVRRFFEDAVAASAERFVQDAGRVRDDAERRMAKADASRLALLSAVTHDLRGFLQTLTLAIEAVGSEVPEAERQRSQNVCRRNLADMGALLEELTEYGGLLAGQVRPEPETFAVADFAGELAAAFGPLTEANRVDLRVDADVALEAAESDPRRLRQVVANLILNALKYRRRDGWSAWIRLALEAAPGDRWRIAVEDNGVGIAPEDLERIFEEFQRVASSEDIPGTGLGLTITRRLVDLLGGEVRVSSTPGEGSRFEVDLPRRWSQPTPSNNSTTSTAHN